MIDTICWSRIFLHLKSTSRYFNNPSNTSWCIRNITWNRVLKEVELLNQTNLWSNYQISKIRITTSIHGRIPIFKQYCPQDTQMSMTHHLIIKMTQVLEYQATWYLLKTYSFLLIILPFFNEQQIRKMIIFNKILEIIYKMTSNKIKIKDRILMKLKWTNKLWQKYKTKRKTQK